ncbi:MAG: 16S rRNA (cytosine(1402)-N(4))-methyltransferase RsmH [Candidatus Omnitrophica bacterium]|nr:16S rRNA (cytosine(1402)-N(4))-methyltransferase RsmH [Candidatus Omnitrophota bacterium]
MLATLDGTQVENKYHIPVMLEEVITRLNLGPGKTIVDATCGTGGHTLAILERIMPGGRAIAIDRDKESLETARMRLIRYSDSCNFVHGNFTRLDEILNRLKVNRVDGILFDLGISSFQLADPRRGFSFQVDAPLDMRMDRDSYISAYDLLNNLNEEEISALLWNFGEERWHRRIARLIVEERQRHPISTTQQLVNIVLRSIPGRYRYKYQRIHPATRTFQAVRIAVNRELEILEPAIEKAVGLLNRGGRICVISFHSLEDRIAKHTFKRLSASGAIEVITPKPKTPSQAEVETNPLSRSAKLRAAEKI